MTREEKMKIVINNYFKTECSVNTSIREAFEKGFLIGASKVQKKRGKWIPVTNSRGGHECDKCHNYAPSYQNSKEHLSDFCPSCGADMRGEQDE